MYCEEGFVASDIGLIPNDWDVREIKEILQNKGYIRGPFGSALRRPEMKTEGIPVYEQANAIYNHRNFRFYIDEQKHEQLKRFTVKENDLLISCSGTFGKISIIHNEDPKGIISQALLILRPDTKKVNPNFLKYFFLSDKGYNALASRSLGSVQVNIAKREVIEKIQLAIPKNRNEQDAIVKILKSLDDKIKLLNETNETLEQIAKALFKHWFVNFEFPDENGNPYKSSGGIMKPSEVGMIPSDWDLVNLDNVADVIDCLHSKKPQKQEIGHLLLQVYNVGENGLLDLSDPYFISENDFEMWTRRMILKKGDIIITKTGRVGAFARIPHGVSAAMGRNMVGIRAKTELMSHHFLIDLFSSKWIQDEIRKKTHDGTILKTLHVKSISTLQLPLPPNNLINKYEMVVQNIHEKFETNNEHIQSLTELHDLLLPRLMSGRIRVPVKEGDEACQV